MTSSVIKKYALAALCGAAIIGVGQSAQAATWSIVLGVPSAPSSAANYGTAPNQNNVINNPASATHDLINVPINTSIFQNSNLNAGTFVGSYNVDWFYLGSESDNKNDFAANGVALANGGVIGYQEINANNNCAALSCGVSPQIGPQLMGSSLNQTALTPFFEFRDQTDGSNVVNGFNRQDTAGPNFLISYATEIGGQLFLTTSVSDWVVIGYNDTGFPDDNHDDFMVAAHITDAGLEQNPTPIPGALPLFASVLGGGFLFRRLRNRRQAKAAA